jgi:hypothetical protein
MRHRNYSNMLISGLIPWAPPVVLPRRDYAMPPRPAHQTKPFNEPQTVRVKEYAGRMGGEWIYC